MRRIQGTILAAAVILASAGSVYAQTSVNTMIEVTRSDIQADRKAIVAHNLPLTEAQSAAFWPVYNSYRAELNRLGDRLWALVTDFAKNYQTLTDDKAATFTSEMLSIQNHIATTKSEYQAKFTAVLPAKLVMRFYQIDNKLDAILMMDAASGIPLAK